MLRYLPLVAALVAVAGVAVYDGLLNHRWIPNYEAESYAEMLETVPTEIGPWTSKDSGVDDELLRVAGAVGHVSRAYIHSETQEVVKVWLIVGPFRHVVRHTPDVCYPAQDFHPAGKIADYTFDADGVQNIFRSNIYARRGDAEQVFWSWLRPAASGKSQWYGAHLNAVRERYAGSHALFKLYFTTSVSDPNATASDSIANDFAKEFLPTLTGMIDRTRDELSDS